MNIRGIIEDYLSDEEAEEFAFFAFGESYKIINLDSIDPLILWNLKHGDLLKLDPRNSPRDDIPKMIEIWKNNVASTAK